MKLQVGRATPKADVHPLVLAVLQAVHKATGDRRAPFYVGVDDLDLVPDDQERNGAAIQLAEYRGWVVVGGKPAHSVAITASGLAVLRDKGMAGAHPTTRSIL